MKPASVLAAGGLVSAALGTLGFFRVAAAVMLAANFWVMATDVWKRFTGWREARATRRAMDALMPEERSKLFFNSVHGKMAVYDLESSYPAAWSARLEGVEVLKTGAKRYAFVTDAVSSYPTITDYPSSSLVAGYERSGMGLAVGAPLWGPSDLEPLPEEELGVSSGG